MTTRRATHADLAAITILFRQSVLKVTTHEYDYKQRQAWAARGTDALRWKSRIDNLYFLVAEQQEQLVGFAAIDDKGHLDLLYVHHDQQKKGIATNLLHASEAWARRQGITKTTTDASATARPFFECKGYYTTREQQNALEDQLLINYRMEKTL